MTNLYHKSIHVLRNQGVKALAMRGAHVISFQAQQRARRVLPAPLRRHLPAVEDEYLFIGNPIFQVDSQDIAKSKQATSVPLPKKIKTANWFVPYFDHLAFGGIFTIFRFINYQQEHGVQNRIVIYDNPSVDRDKMWAEIVASFPALKNAELIIYDPLVSTLDDLPACDIAFCTFWVSAYLLLKFNKTKRKYYFVQDYEPLFYTAGATYALAESTYRFGFRAIVNTPGLLAAINQRHGTEGISFVPAVDGTLYYPAKVKSSDGPVKIFFYARPKNPRNAFYLGVEIIKELKQRYGDRVEVITAGAEWSEQQYGLGGMVTNLGLLKTLPEVADLYRKCDIGFVYMLTKHPSYQPFEFMASGMATVTNNNEDNWWMLKDGENCLLAEPSPKAMAEQIGRLIDDPSLRHKIAKAGADSIQREWSQQLEAIWNDIKNF